MRVHPAPVSDGHVLTGQRGQATPLGQRHHRHQARPRHEIRVIERHVDLGNLMQQSHLSGAPSGQLMEASATPIVPGQGAPFASTRRPRALFMRSIEAKSIDPAAFYERLHLLESQVCWISIAGGGGTGFLVGPDLVLTNQHVIDRLAKGLARWQDVRCRFDYCEPASGSPLTYIRPTDVGLAHPWLIDSRPPSRYDRHPQLGDAAPEETDSALIRLADPIGDFPVRVDSGDPGAELRKWITASSPPPPLAVGNQVFLLQHPEGKPLRLTIGTVTEFNEAGTRVRYDANSLGGASGSPLFDADLQLVALHHAHDLARPPRWNEAIPLGVIQAASRAHDVILH